MTTEKCDHLRKLSLSCKCSDMATIRFPDGRKHDGYMIRGFGMGGGDYVNLTVCIDCKVVIDLPDAERILEIQEEVFE